MADGADGIELDVFLSRDEELVVFHDATLDKLSDGTGPLEDRTLAQLRQLRLKAIAGGLSFSTLVSLLFLPTIYAMLDDWRTKSGKKWAWARDWQWRGKKSKLPPVESSLLH